MRNMFRGVLKTGKWVSFILVITFILYVILLEPWHTNWGTTDAEARMSVPGDELVLKPNMITTRAITIKAPIDKVWPWLVQLGQGRGGLYSYDWLENFLGMDIHSVDKIIPSLQHLKEGDSIRLSKYKNQPSLPVVALEPNKQLSLGADTWLWTFYINKIDDNTTRLIVRTNIKWTNLSEGIPIRYVLVPITFVMERKMLLGIKERAEQ